MTFNILYGTLQKARKSSRILFPSTASTTSIPEELLKERYDLFHVTNSSNGKSPTPYGQRPYTAFSFNERHIHTSVSRYLCSEEKEKTESDKKEDIIRKNEQVSSQNNKLKVNNLYKKRSFHKIRHQNLVWDGSNKRNRFSKYKMSTTIGERNKELSEKKLNDIHSILYKKSEMDSTIKNQNNGELKTQNSSVKNILTIDILPDTNNNFVPQSSQFKALLEDNINGSSKINTTTTSVIENPNELISLKGAYENMMNNWENNSLITKSTIKNCAKANLPLSNQNKDKVSMKESVLRNKYEEQKVIKNVNQDNSILFYNKGMDISGKKPTDIRNYKFTKNSPQNKNSIEFLKKDDSKSINNTKSRSDISEEKDNLDGRNCTRATTDGEKTVWNTIYKQNKSQMLLNDLQYHINLKNKIKNNLKKIDLNHRNKFASSINNILRPVKSKAQIVNKIQDNQLLSKNVNATIVPPVNSVQNIIQKMCHQNDFVMNNTPYLKTVKYGKSSLNQILKNTSNAHLTVSRNKIKNKIQLIKDIKSANLNKKSLVTNLKHEIKSWKKYEFIKKLVKQSTSEIYKSIMNNRKLGKITNDTIYTPRKKTQQKCSVISIPLVPKADINKYQKTTQTLMKINNTRNRPVFSSKSDPIVTLNRKYKKNYQSTFNELLKKSEILINQEKFKKNPKILDYDPNMELKTEFFFKKPEEKNLNLEKNLKVFMKNAKKISLEHKKPWVRYMHQMNDEIKGKPSVVTEISTYPSGCLKKPEFIIELLPLKDENKTEILKLEHHNNYDPQTDKRNFNTKTDSIEIPKSCVSNTFNKENEKSESSTKINTITKPAYTFKISEESEGTNMSITNCEKGKEKPISFSDLCKIKSGMVNESKHTVSEKKDTSSEKISQNQKTYCPLCKSPFDLGHCLSYESFEEMEPKKYTNKLNNDSMKGEVREVIKDCFKRPLEINRMKFQTEKFDNNRIKKEIESDCISRTLNNTLNSDNKAYISKGEQFPANNIKVEVCSNIIYEQPIQNSCYKEAFPEENKTAMIEKQNPKFIDSTKSAQETIPSENYTFHQNQPRFLKTDISKNINSMPKKQSSYQLHGIEISFSSSKQSVLEETNKFKGSHMKCLTKAAAPKSESNNNLRSSNINYEQQLNSCKNLDNNKYEIANNSSKNFHRDINFQHSNSDSNINTLSKETIYKCLNQKELKTDSLKKKMKGKDVTSLETRKTSSVSNLQISQQNQNEEKIMQQSNNQVENLISDIKEFKLSSFLKKYRPEISSFTNGNKKAFIDNIKDFFRNSYNYFKLDYPTKKASMDVFLNNPNSKDMHNINQKISNSFREENSCSKQPVSVSESNKQSCTTLDYSNFRQKFIDTDKIEGKPIKLLHSHTSQHGTEDTIMSGNEFQRICSNMTPVSSKGQFPTTTKKLEDLTPNIEIYINDLETGTKKKTDFLEKPMQHDNMQGSNTSLSNFLNKAHDKDLDIGTDKVHDIENFSVNQIKQPSSLYNLIHKKSNMKFSSKNRLYSQRYKQRFAKANVINIKNKLRGIHYPMNSKMPLDEISNLMMRGQNRRSDIIPFNLALALKPVKLKKPMKNSSKIKNDHSEKLYSDVKLYLKIAQKSTLLKTLQSLQKSSEKSNPESYLLNCFSKNDEHKISRNEFLTYIKKRKLPRKLSLKSNN